MARLRIIRHGEAAATFGEAADPPLSEAGHVQAAALADAMATTPRAPIFSSPLVRARETAAPLAKKWGVSVAIAPMIREIPSPVDDLGERHTWLMEALGSTWSAMPAEVQDWRYDIIAASTALMFSQVWISHYVVVNALASFAMESDDVTVAQPGYCSVTEFDVTDGQLTIVKQGDEGITVIR